jgi:transposase
MVLERTSVGLDVHARSIVAGVLDSVTGELWSRRLPPATEAVVAWIGSLPGPAAVAYEAGPTGFGLARALQQVGVRCVVVAPSKLERPSRDRVKTDRRDAERLARLLHIGELAAVRVPTELEEAARDLVRAREDARADLMRARIGCPSCCCAMGWSSRVPPGPRHTSGYERPGPASLAG